MSSLNLMTLNRDERRELAQIIDDILEYLNTGVRKSDDVTRRRLEEKIANALKRIWEAKTEEAKEEAIRLLRQYSLELDKLKAKSIADELGAFTTGRIIQAVIDKGVINNIQRAYDIAGESTARKLKLPYSLTFVDDYARDWLKKDTIYWIGEYYNKHIKDAVTGTVIQYAIEEGQDFWTVGQRIKEVLNGTYEIPPKYLPKSYIRHEAYWQLLASAAVTRATVFGNIEPMLAADVKEYQILAAKDERTCPLCSRMNGKKFRIEHAVELRDKILEAKDPEDIKTIHPWKRANEIKNWDSESLAKEGLSLPPFHGHCRCTVIAVT